MLNSNSRRSFYHSIFETISMNHKNKKGRKKNSNTLRKNKILRDMNAYKNRNLHFLSVECFSKDTSVLLHKYILLTHFTCAAIKEVVHSSGCIHTEYQWPWRQTNYQEQDLPDTFCTVIISFSVQQLPVLFCRFIIIIALKSQRKQVIFIFLINKKEIVRSTKAKFGKSAN